MNAALYAVGGVVFVGLGLAHAAFTLADLAHPRRLVPHDRSVMAAMQGTGVRLAGNSSTTMWRAWVGFNLSHSLGAVLFGLAAAFWSHAPAALAALPAVVAAAYGAIGWRCWFWKPNLGLAVAALCFLVAAVV